METEKQQQQSVVGILIDFAWNQRILGWNAFVLASYVMCVAGFCLFVEN